MPNPTYSIIRQSDASLTDSIISLATSFNAKKFEISFTAASRQIATFNSIESLKEDKDINYILNLGTTSIETINFNINGVTAHITRNFSSTSDTLTIEAEQSANTGVPIAHISAFTKGIKEILHTLDSITPISSTNDEGIKEYLIKRDSYIQRIEDANERALQGTMEHRNRLDEDYQKKVLSLDADFDAKRKSLEAEYTRRISEIDETKSAYEKKTKEIDDRENTHVRRETVSNFKAELKERFQEFKLTDGTIRLRRPTELSLYILFVIFLSLTIYYIAYYYKNIPTGIYDAIGAITKQLTSILGMATTAIYYIKWNNKYFQKYADEEFHQKNYSSMLKGQTG